MELSLIGKDTHRRERELAEIRAKGIAEGRIEGREQGPAAERKRWQQWNEARMRAADVNDEVSRFCGLKRSHQVSVQRFCQSVWLWLSPASSGVALRCGCDGNRPA